MDDHSIIQKILADQGQWDDLPLSLKAHYQAQATGKPHSITETGKLTVRYPKWMQPLLSIMKLFGILLDRRGEEIPTHIEKWLEANRQYWIRTMTFEDGSLKQFSTFLEKGGKTNETVEYVNDYLGLKMIVSRQGDDIVYESVGYVCRIGRLQILIPNGLGLGKGYIREIAIDEKHFHMNFTLQHPLLGQIFQYEGMFKSHHDGKR